MPFYSIINYPNVLRIWQIPHDGAFSAIEYSVVYLLSQRSLEIVQVLKLSYVWPRLSGLSFPRPDTPAAGKWDMVGVPLFNFMIQQFIGLTPNTHLSVYLCRYLSSPPKIIFAQ